MSRARDLADGTFTGEVTVNDTVRLDTGDTTVSTDDVFGDIEFYDNDGGSAGAGVTAKIQATAASTYGASQLIFSTSSSSGGARTALTERIRILSSGGITFNGDTAAANALDDYEEGSFNLTINGSGSNPSTLQTIPGTYVKIGKQVHITAASTSATNTTGYSGYIYLSGMPFTPSAAAMGNVMSYYALTFSYDGGLVSYFDTGGYIYVYENASNNYWRTVNINPTATTFLKLSGTYHTS